MLQFESRIPSVSVVIATNGKRMQSLRTAVTAILDQQYPGPVEVVIVYDRATPDPLSDIEISENRSLRIIENTRTGGLAGARNSGILEATGIILGFCDDDDTWMPGKLTEQVALWRANPDAVGISSGITVRSDGRNIVRLAPERATFDDFLRSRITEVHPSAMLYSRSDLVDGPVGLVDEQLPASYGEDYDLLLRATKHGDILSVPQPLVRVLWDRPSFFAGQWQYIADGLTYLLRKFPEFERYPKGVARVAGQVAFAHAALGHKKEAFAFARSSLHRDKTQLRAWAAYPVALGVVKPHTLLDAVQKTGRGL